MTIDELYRRLNESLLYVRPEVYHGDLTYSTYTKQDDLDRRAMVAAVFDAYDEFVRTNPDIDEKTRAALIRVKVSTEKLALLKDLK